LAQAEHHPAEPGAHQIEFRSVSDDKTFYLLMLLQKLGKEFAWVAGPLELQVIPAVVLDGKPVPLLVNSKALASGLLDTAWYA
jgi:hypothetical protein